MKTLLRQVDSIRCEHNADRVTEVRVEVGPLSGVEPMLLSSAFALLASEQTVAGARLVIDKVPLLAHCEACDKEFEVNGFVFRCPTCRGNVKTISGDEFHLLSVSLSEANAEFRDSLDPSSHNCSDTHETAS
ncbi:MAG: hydrogenase maturation nickel metallochaperone HypA [Planctomycetes bacterium]|nr:hydrogenase maturation nickel metallochaperone HypA [Planctomycetota bacterium]